MNDHAALIARLREAMEGYDSDTLGDDPHEFDSWKLLHDAKAALEAVQQEVVALTAEADRAIDQANNLAGDLAVQQVPAVDREALAAVIHERFNMARGRGGVAPLALADQILASGILQDAAEVEARGLEKFGLWLLDIGHMPDLGRANMKFLVEQFARAQQVREGN